MKAFRSFSVLFALLLALACGEPSQTKISSSEVKELHFSSDIIGNRQLSIYFPDTYDGKKPHQVLYMMDGQMLFDSTTTWNGQSWAVDRHISVLRDSIYPTIVVGIWNADGSRHAEYFPQAPFEYLPQAQKDSILKLNRGDAPLFEKPIYSDEYLVFLVEELKPFIDSTFTTIPDSKHTFICGSSMGGLIAMYAHCEYPQVFGGSASLSTHWPGIFSLEYNPVPSAFQNYLAENIPEPKKHFFYFDFGTETLDSLYEDAQLKVDSIFKAKGYTDKHYKSLKFEGADHSEKAWNRRLNIPFKFLLSQ